MEEREFINASRLVYDGLREIRSTVLLNKEEEDINSDIESDDIDDQSEISSQRPKVESRHKEIVLLLLGPGNKQYTAHGTLHITHCTLHIAHCALKTAHCILHTAHCTLHIAVHTAYCTLHSKNITLHTAYCTLHSINSTLHTAYCTLHTAYCTLHTAPPPGTTGRSWRPTTPC